MRAKVSETMRLQRESLADKLEKNFLDDGVDVRVSPLTVAPLDSRCD